MQLSEQERAQLQSWVRSRTSPFRLVQRSRIVLLHAAGLSAHAIASRVGVAPGTARLWIQRFLKVGVSALSVEAPRGGRPAGSDPNMTLAVLRATRQLAGTGAGVRQVSTVAGVSASSVWRVWKRLAIDTEASVASLDALVIRFRRGTSSGAGQT
jgi:transposase